MTPEQLAAHLKTRPEWISALENGHIAALPAWEETARIVLGYASMLKLDGQPILRRIALRLAPEAVATSSKTSPNATASVRVNADAGAKTLRVQDQAGRAGATGAQVARTGAQVARNAPVQTTPAPRQPTPPPSMSAAPPPVMPPRSRVMSRHDTASARLQTTPVSTPVPVRAEPARPMFNPAPLLAKTQKQTLASRLEAIDYAGAEPDQNNDDDLDPNRHIAAAIRAAQERQKNWANEETTSYLADAVDPDEYNTRRPLRPELVVDPDRIRPQPSFERPRQSRRALFWLFVGTVIASSAYIAYTGATKPHIVEGLVNRLPDPAPHYLRSVWKFVQPDSAR